MKGGLPGMNEALHPRVAVGPLGDADQGCRPDPQVGQHRQHLASWPVPAVDQHQVGADHLLARILVLHQTAKRRRQHLAHHAVVVARVEILAA
jgi:hypothetical protein